MSCQMHLAIESARGEMQSRQRGEGGDGPSFFEAAAIPVESGTRSEALNAKLADPIGGGVFAAKPQCPHRLVVRTSRRGRDNPGSTPGVVKSLMPSTPATSSMT